MTETSSVIGGRPVAYWRSEPAETTSASALPPTAGTVLLLHGLGADHRALLPLAHQWPRADIVAPDLPGFGRSGPLSGRHTLTSYADTIEEFCEDLALGDVILIGHSLGANIGLAIAARHPHRVRALVLLSPVTAGLGPYTWAARAYFGLGSRLPPAAARLWFLSRAAIYLTDMSAMVTKDRQLRQRILQLDYSAAELASLTAIVDTYRSMRRVQFAAVAAKVRAPTLVLGAEQDGLAPPKALAALRRRLSSSRLVIVPGAGHLWVVEEPDAAAQVIATSLQPLLA